MLNKTSYTNKYRRNRKPILKYLAYYSFPKLSNTFNISLPKQIHEISFHLEAAWHQNQGLGTSCRCHNLEQFLLRPSAPCHRHSVGKGSCSGEKQAGQDFLGTENVVKHTYLGHRFVTILQVFFNSVSKTQNYHFLPIPTQDLCLGLDLHSIPMVPPLLIPLKLSPCPDFTLFLQLCLSHSKRYLFLLLLLVFLFPGLVFLCSVL